MDVTVVYIWTNSPPPPLSVDQRNAGAHNVNLFEWGRRGYRYCLKGIAMLLWKFPPYLLLCLPLHPTTLWKCCGMKWLLLCYNLYYMVVIRPVFSAWYYSISVFLFCFLNLNWCLFCKGSLPFRKARIPYSSLCCRSFVFSFVGTSVSIVCLHTYIRLYDTACFP